MEAFARPGVGDALAVLLNGFLQVLAVVTQAQRCGVQIGLGLAQIGELLLDAAQLLIEAVQLAVDGRERRFDGGDSSGSCSFSYATMRAGAIQLAAASTMTADSLSMLCACITRLQAAASSAPSRQYPLA